MRRGGLTIGGTLAPLADDQLELAREIAANLQIPDVVERHVKIWESFRAPCDEYRRSFH